MGKSIGPSVAQSKQMIRGGGGHYVIIRILLEYSKPTTTSDEVIKNELHTTFPEFNDTGVVQSKCWRPGVHNVRMVFVSLTGIAVGFKTIPELTVRAARRWPTFWDTLRLYNLSKEFHL